MDIYRCQNKAKDMGFNTTEFDILTSKGIITCAWEDADLGLIRIMGVPGLGDSVIRVKEFDEVFPCIEILALRVNKPSSERQTDGK